MFAGLIDLLLDNDLGVCTHLGAEDPFRIFNRDPDLKTDDIVFVLSQGGNSHHVAFKRVVAKSVYFHTGTLADKDLANICLIHAPLKVDLIHIT